MNFTIVSKASKVVSFTSTSSPDSLTGPKNIALNAGLTAARRNLCAGILLHCPSSSFTRKATSGGRWESGARKLRQSASASDIFKLNLSSWLRRQLGCLLDLVLFSNPVPICWSSLVHRYNLGSELYTVSKLGRLAPSLLLLTKLGRLGYSLACSFAYQVLTDSLLPSFRQQLS